jgi:trehalose 2-sulfotransferase
VQSVGFADLYPGDFFPSHPYWIRLPSDSKAKIGTLLRVAREGHEWPAVPVHTSCLIATLPRSGSTLLAHALARSGIAGSASEYFRPDFVHIAGRDWGLDIGSPATDLISAAMRTTATDNGVFSVKTHWFQFHWLCDHLFGEVSCAEVAAKLGELMPGLRYVYLSREDKAAQAVSFLRAVRTWKWQDSASEQTAEETDLPIDLQQLRYFEDRLTYQEGMWQRYFEEAGIEPLRITYSDLADDYDSTIRRVLSFISGDSASGTIPQPVLRKQAGRSSADWIEAYRLVSSHLMPFTDDLVWSRLTQRWLSPDSKDETRRILAVTPPDWRQYVALCLREGDSHESIAAEMGTAGFAEVDARAVIDAVSADPLYELMNLIELDAPPAPRE